MRESTVDSQDSVIFVKNQRETSAIGNGEHGEIDQSKRTRRRQKQVLDHAPLDTPPAFDSSHNSSFRIGHTKAQSFDHKATEKQKRLRKQSKHRTTKEDGLRDDISELSSDVSFEMVSRSQSLANVSVKFPQQTVIAELGLPSHPLRHPPSPPMTLEQALTISPRGAQRPTTPQQGFPFPPARFSSPGSTLRQRKPARESVSLLHPPSLHLPFILAYDSELLTKQFTLIEKDALNEIDWKELVELRWKQTSTTVRDWVEFLRSKNVRGVEVVIARFNLVRVPDRMLPWQ